MTALTPTLIEQVVAEIGATPTPIIGDADATGADRVPVRLDIAREGVGLTELGKLVDAACGTGASKLLDPTTFSWVPSVAGTIRLLRAEFDPTPENAWHTLLELGLPGAEWELLPGVLTLHDPRVSIFVPSSGTPTITVNAAAKLLGHVHLIAGVSVQRTAANGATFAFDAELAPGHGLKVGAALESMGLALPGTEALEISELRCAWGGEDNVDVGITVDHVWSPGWGDGSFALEEVAIGASIPIAADGGHRTIDGTLAGRMRVGPAAVDALVVHNGDTWRADLNVVFEPPARLHDAVTAIAAMLGLDAVTSSLPDFGALTIDGASTSVDIVTHEASLTVRSTGGWHPDWLPGFSIEGLEVTVDHHPATGVDSAEPSGTELAATGTIKLNDQPLAVEITHDGRHGGWVLQAEYPEEWTLADAVNALPAELGLSADAIPLDLSAVHITNTTIEADSLAGTATVALHGTIALTSEMEPVNRPQFSLNAEITTTPDGSREVALGGTITIGALNFSLAFIPEKHAFVGSYATHAGADDDIGALVSALTGVSDVHVGFGIRDAVIVAVRKADGDGHDMLLAVDVDGGMDLSALPLISKVIAPKDGLQVAFQARWAGRDFPADEVGGYQALLPHGAPPIVAEGSTGPVPKGPALAVHVRVAGTAFELDWGMELGGGSGSMGHSADSAPAEPASTTSNETGNETAAPDPALVATGPDKPLKWFDVQKTLGPLRVDRFGVGLNIAKQQIVAAVDTDLTMAALTLSAMGLGATYDLTDHGLGFRLDGIGVAYDGGPTQISGALLGITEGEFVGDALLKTPTFTLSALGGYTTVDGDPAMFVEAFLDKPIGGPPFAFVTGLAAGFGFNRLLADVELDKLPEHPFIVQAMGTEVQPSPPQSPADTQAALDASLRKLDKYIVPKSGEYFLAVGVKFTSFKIIDSFALAVARFGRHFTLDVLGLSTAVLPPRPPDAPPDPSAFKLAVVQLALDAKLDPDAGLFRVDAVLTDESWVLSRDCHLTGGFAFATWFAGEHDGDFVTTLGGYHPDFKIPAHYPQPDRLTLSWHVCDEVDISGDCYFALTPNNLMAGGHLHAHWHTGDLWATFSVGADFLMQWKPFHYIASAGIEIAAGYGSLSGSVGADLTLWGPDFTGTARIHLGPFISFDVDFGDADPEPQALTWNEFQQAFLPPANDDLLQVAPMHGVIRSIAELGDNGEATPLKRWVVNPKEFTIAATSMVPLHEVAYSAGHNADVAPIDVARATPTGIAPMDRKVAPTTASLDVTLHLGTDRIDHSFEVIPQARAFPAALWGTAGKSSDLDGDRTIDALGTTLIRPRHPATPGKTAEIRRGNLKFFPHLVTPPADSDLTEAGAADAARHAALDANRTTESRHADRATVAAGNTPAAHAARATLVAALGFRPEHDIRLPSDLAVDLVGAPRVARNAADVGA